MTQGNHDLPDPIQEESASVPPVDDKPASPLGRLPRLAPPEGPIKRTIFILAAVVIIGWFFYSMTVYNVPAHSGTDQNGYLAGGRMVAESGTMKLAPRRPDDGQFDPFQFVGRMWVGADTGTDLARFYPKYPIGLPLLVALALNIGGETWGPVFVYWINPIAMALALAAVFLLVRLVIGSFLAVLALAVVASSPVTMLLATNPNSHATTLFCVAWGMYLLLSWWQRDGWARALFAGLFLGYAATIRYTEAMLILPILLVILFRIRGGVLKQSGLLLLGWAIPIGLLALYNLIAMGTLTGYDPTNESKPYHAFTFEHFTDNWETMLRHLATNGLFFIFPIAVAGLVWMFWWSWRLALLMFAWIVPCLLVYTFYYWAPDTSTTGYLRFFLSIFPALALCAFWLMSHIADLMLRSNPSRWANVATSLSAGVLTAGAVAVHLQNNAPALEQDYYTRRLLAYNADEILKTAPKGSVIFSSDQSLLNHLQFARDYVLYDLNVFRQGNIQNLVKDLRADDPQGLDPVRRQALYDRLKDLDQKALEQQQRQLAEAWLAQGRRVFVLESAGRGDPRNPRPRALHEMARKLADEAPQDATPLYADVVHRWKINVEPKWPYDVHDETERRQPRNRPQIMRYQANNLPWLIYEVAQAPLQTSPERQALADFAAAEKAKNDKLAAERAEAERIRQEKIAADRERQRLENERRAAAEKARRDQLVAEEKTVRERIAAAEKASQEKLAAAKAAADKAIADRMAADRAAERAKADEQLAQRSLAQAKSEHVRLAEAIEKSKAEEQSARTTLEELRREQRQLEDQLAAARRAIEELTKAEFQNSEVEVPSTQPLATQPAYSP